MLGELSLGLILLYSDKTTADNPPSTTQQGDDEKRQHSIARPYAPFKNATVGKNLNFTSGLRRSVSFTQQN